MKHRQTRLTCGSGVIFFRQYQNKLKCLLFVFALSFIGACTTPKPEPIPEPEPAPPVVKKIEPSAAPIIKADKLQIQFAQTALRRIGYKIGAVDGIWGPRSASAIRAFEVQHKLWSADGHLSELNLQALAKVSGLSREDFETKPKLLPAGITSKLKPGIPLSAGPQLIIVDKEYKVLSKPNPYSSQVLTLAAGTGIYVLSKQQGWFEIESINRRRGFVRAD